MERVAEGEVVLLHADDVREVRLEVQLEREGDRRARLVAEHDVVLEPAADKAAARDREGILREAVDRRVA